MQLNKIKLSDSVTVSAEFRKMMDAWLLDVFGERELTVHDNQDCRRCRYFVTIGHRDVCQSTSAKEGFQQNPFAKQARQYWCPEGKTLCN